MVYHRAAFVASIAFFQTIMSVAPGALAQSGPYGAAYERSKPGGGIAFGLSAGTLGVGAELSYKLSSNLVVRGGASGMSYEGSETKNDIDYDLATSIRSASVTLDYHPFGNGLRLSIGGRYLDMKFTGKSSAAASYDVGARTYSFAEIGHISADIETSADIAPYLGIGFDSSHFSDSRFSLSLDIGAVYVGNTDVKLSADGFVPGLSEDLALEAKEIEDKINKYSDFYPVVMLSAKMRF